MAGKEERAMLFAGDKDKRNDDNESFYDLLFSDEGDVPEAPAQEIGRASCRERV